MLKRVVFGGLLGLLAGCGGSNPKQSMPDWYMSATSDEEYIIAVGESESRVRRYALRVATAEASAEIAREVERYVINEYKGFAAESGDPSDPVVVNTMQDVVWSSAKESLKGATSVAREFQAFEKPDGGDADKEPDIFYRAFVKLQLNRSVADAELASRVRKNAELYARFRASEAFQEVKDRHMGE